MTDDPIARGLADQLSSPLTGTAIGWKVGFASPAQMAAFGTDLPLTGRLSSDRVLAIGATVDLRGWVKPVLEAEIAVRLGADLPGDCDAATAAAAVDAVTSAIELADLDGPVDDARSILAGNVFHRAVVLGTWDETRSGLALDGVALTVRGTDADVACVGPEDGLGSLAALLAGVARRLAPTGAQVRAGDVVITGAVVPPIPVTAGQQVEVVFSSLPPLTLRFA